MTTRNVLRFTLTRGEQAHICGADDPAELVLRFWRDVALPRYGLLWEDYSESHPLPTMGFSIPEAQWLGICEYANTMWGFQGGGTWMNWGPSSH